MNESKLSIEINSEHPSYIWAKNQSNSVNAFGHIGTHIDCYTKEPDKSHFELEVVTINCSNKMPSSKELKSLDISGKAVLLYTGNLETNGYGTPEYGAECTILKEDVLDQLLSKHPSFIMIDSYGIGAHGEEHISFDKKCEFYNCFVIENLCVSGNIAESIRDVIIEIDKTSDSTGKKCLVTAKYI
ncbi:MULTISPECIES: cyclase family protein [unclassified Oceanispirochaeta]|uniref:cyclase family protein n=1 Tax=unclassified Oceanispirochaeta TaxID=2635722 RepID=UPI000E0919E8|nr:MULTISPECIES: cyclase family protein [unclassified Oceanispirochaeta]MBF9018113.1 cyclase family protein [Oceanispirochaeta sp. M2]NPD74577.1 hypothetical protein [Oceanispirochaeta sp. M1]RDG29606.1 hypothetical protein DV872_20975 [Oceanispirochaeta sp. M1]